MSDQSNLPPSIMSHVSVGTNDLAKAKAFYAAVLDTVGAKVLHEVPGHAVAFGRQFPEFWVGVPHDGQIATVGNGAHFSFLAVSKEVVDAFYIACLEHGGVGDGLPGPREHYGPAYYGAFAKDLDGNKIEAMFWDESLAK
jgi:catechol 2,3-dioxygenase-like lactoylglutathione lyase family enzyme